MHLCWKITFGCGISWLSLTPALNPSSSIRARAFGGAVRLCVCVRACAFEPSMHTHKKVTREDRLSMCGSTAKLIDESHRAGLPRAKLIDESLCSSTAQKAWLDAQASCVFNACFNRWSKPGNTCSLWRQRHLYPQHAGDVRRAQGSHKLRSQ